jgi:hypothetical protein
MVQPHNIATRNDNDHTLLWATLLWATLVVMSIDDDATPKDVAKKEILTNLNNNLPKIPSKMSQPHFGQVWG